MSTPSFTKLTPGRHLVRGIPFKAHKINGFSPAQFERHYEDVYGVAVRRLNAIEREIAVSPNDADLWSEHLRTANAVVLHEIYFGSIGEDGGTALSDGILQSAIEASFGHAETWQNEFSAMASSSETGWIVLVWSDRFGRLMNLCLADDTWSLTGAVPILAIDMDQHAFATDFGSDRAVYVAAFVDSIHWDRVAERFRQALCAPVTEEEPDAHQISVAELHERLDAGEDLLVIDVRHDDDRERYTNRIMETEWRDSFDVAGWAGDLPKDKPVVVYCMYGFWVSQKAAEELRDHGVDARSLSGGVTAWRAMGLRSTSTES